MAFNSRDILEQLLNGEDLAEDQAFELMCALAEDDMAPAQAHPSNRVTCL